MEANDVSQPQQGSSAAAFARDANRRRAEAEESLGAALRRAVRDLRASSGILFVPTRDGQELAATVVAGGALSIFTTAERVRVSDERYTAAAAYRTGVKSVFFFSEMNAHFDRRAVTMPFPYSVASFPVRSVDICVGVISFVWAPPLGPRDISVEIDEYCEFLAEKLSRDVQILGDLRSDTDDFVTPHFLMPVTDKAAAKATGASQDMEFSLLHHVYRLASALAEAAGMRDVVKAVATRIARPVGAQAMAVVAHDLDRLHVIGYSGYPETVALPPVGGEAFDVYIPSLTSPLFLESKGAVASSHLGGFTEGMQACAVLPLLRAGHGVGALLLGFVHPRFFGAEERAVLVTMAGLVAPSLERARLFDAQQSLAQELQQGLLPRTLPHLAELDTTARYFPATLGGDVGGDWYDVLTLPDGRVGLVIGDVEGHSTTGAALMGQIRSAVRAYAAEGHGPTDVLGRTSRLLHDLGADRFATCCCVWIDCAEATAEIVCAGHHGPLLHGPEAVAGVPDLLTGPPLGVTPDAVYRSIEVVLPAGTVLALFTDGLVHSHSLDLEAGFQAVSDVLAEGWAQHLETLADRLVAIVGAEGNREDDAALLLARYGGPSSCTSRVERMFVQRHDLRAVCDVRRFVRSALSHWNEDALADDAELMATELVTNALIHADSEVDVRLREAEDRIRVEVRDSDPRPPLPAPITFTSGADGDSEHGRGLLIVEALASAWGNAPRGRGKSVWFEMSR